VGVWWKLPIALTRVPTSTSFNASQRYDGILEIDQEVALQLLRHLDQR
jgi:hypothetical protein